MSFSILRPTFYTALQRWLPWLGGALAISLIVGFTVSWILKDSTPRFSTQIHTSRQGTYALSLPDSSEVILNRDTSLAIAYFSRRRDVTFIHGEAFFKVRWQYRMAFNVRVGTELVKIVDTQVEEPDIAFTVRSDLNTLRVQVQSGHLKVFTATAGPREFIEMRAGDALEVLRAEHRHVLTWVNPATIASWAQP
jgi:ferric-dicitrate binding protein FerR (iron transport regulator)